jgi:hypothetical protein
MISFAVYGGCGFLGIDACPECVKPLEVSFEFGSVTAIGLYLLSGVQKLVLAISVWSFLVGGTILEKKCGRLSYPTILACDPRTPSAASEFALAQSCVGDDSVVATA